MKAIIEVDVPDYQIGQEVSIYFKDTMMIKGVVQDSKTGHWIVKEGREQGYDIAGIKTWYIQIMCDKCGFIKTAIEGHTGQYHFCPNCGCHMVEPQESEVINEMSVSDKSNS